MNKGGSGMSALLPSPFVGKPRTWTLHALRGGFLLLCAAATTGCISFLPAYDEAVHQQLSGAVDEINKIGTAVSLPYRTPAFSEVEPYYIAAASKLSAAEETATGRVMAYSGSVPARAAAIVAQAIENCRRDLELLRDLHRAEGIDGTDFKDSNLRRTCTIPAMMESRLKR